MRHIDFAFFALKKAIIIELKALKSKQSASKLENAAKNALKQIKEKGYWEEAQKKGHKEALCYGIAFFKSKVAVFNEPLSF